ncbi:MULTISPECIES: efflux RND transporter periplasmic adaptor subunit [Nostocales]|uniref:RND transporter n=3 Tax=Nostocales TaxID=1161 RepID=A0A0C1R2R8_9CYAN|nr:efflux RND transporter periplasmic adaptor subunit [Tolypothrix bouteillei]KAF3886016.1 efflux RND transporter periplasmic adaptor subunit [Tolypothrix bouteillei VB521301]
MSKKSDTLLACKVLFPVLLVSALTSACSQDKPKATASEPQPIPVKLQSLQSTTLQDVSEFVGRLEAQQRVSLRPEIEGRIESIPVASGDRVEQGTPIVILRPDRTQPELLSAVARVNSAKSAYLTARSQLKAAEAQQVRDAADVELQKVEFQRTQKLVTEGAQAQQQLDIARKNLNTALATLRATAEQVGAAKASVKQAEANVRQYEADTASARVSLQFKQVLAPITGEVGDFPVKVGDVVSVGQSLTTITQNDNLFLRISIPSNRSSEIRRGLPVELVDAKTRKPLSTGTINFISPEVDTGAQAILTKARFSNSGNNLREGQFVRARVIWNKRSGVLIPTVAVSNLGAQSFVFVAQTTGSKQTVRRQPVQLGAIQGQSYQVINGVKPGDQIAVTQILTLRDGTPIKAN